MACKLHAFQSASLVELTSNINNYIQNLEDGTKVEFHFFDPVTIYLDLNQKMPKTVFSAIVLSNDEDEEDI